MLPVLVVGAGPVGLTMAAELARYRIPVRIVDRSLEPTRTSKALVVWSRTLELMDRMGCTASFLEAGIKAHGATIRDGTKVLGHASFDPIASPYPYALMIPQSETERLLTAHLTSLGIKVERSVNLVDFINDDRCVQARLRHADGREEPIDASWLIGCDGAHSTVRHGLDLPFRGQAQRDDWMLADVRLDGDGSPPPDQIAVFLHRDGPFVIFPIPGGRARIIATVGESDPAVPAPDPSLAEVQDLIDRRAGGGFRASDPLWLSNFHINERKVTDYRKGRAFLAGDAAHVHSPAGGQGMNTGIQDAVGLAWRLALVLQGHGTAELLDSYSGERSAVGDMVLRNATRLTDVGTLSNPAAQAIRNLAIRLFLGFPAVSEKMATQMGEIAIGYPESPLSEGRGAGDRWSPSDYAGQPPGQGRVPLFVLYADDTKRGDELAAQFPQVLEPQARKPPTLRHLIIVRPDGYVGFAGDDDSWDAAALYLRRWTAPTLSTTDRISVANVWSE